MPTINPDLIRNSGVEQQYSVTGILDYARYDRTFYVGDIDTGAVDPQMIQAACVAEVKVAVPIGTPHDDQTLALARFYRALPVASSDGCDVVVTYIYQRLANINPTTYTIESDCGISATETDVEYKDNTYSTKIPIAVRYWRNWALGVNATTGLPTIPAKPTGAKNTPLVATGKGINYKPVGGFTITKTINATKAAMLDAAQETYVGKTNLTLFQGRAPGTLLCDMVRTISNPNLAVYNAILHWQYDSDGVDPYVRFESDQYGVPPNIWRDPADPLPFAQQTSNGMKRTRSVKPVNFDALLAIL